MAAIKYWLWLSSQEELSPKAKSAVIEHYGDAETAFFAPDGDFNNVTGISKRECEILEKRDTGRIDRIFELCQLQGIDLIPMDDPRYPSRLKNIFAPPVLLYVKGSIDKLDEEVTVAVIGTRKATAYGIKMGKKMACDIACQGGTVISLLTEGVDQAAAVGALLGGGRCIGVLGVPIPQELSALQMDIAASGALISEYPPDAQIRKSNFRDRNRVAAGLALAVTVIEAPEKSGTLLFAQEALEQGKEIFALPGNVDAPNSAGTNLMLKQGARPATCAWDVLEDFQPMFPNVLRQTGSTVQIQETDEEKISKKPKNQPTKKKEIDNKKAKGYIDFQEQVAALSPEQQRIISAIAQGNEHIDDIIEATEYSTAKVLSQLTVLEIKGIISRSAGKRIVLNMK
jgi:DNA processing protein